MSFVPLQDSITVTCTPNPVTRGSTVNCTGTPPQGVSLSMNEWRFESQGLTTPISHLSTATSWFGTVAVSGNVRANGDLDGAPSTGSTFLTVNDRDWSQKTVPHQVTEIQPSGLPTRPIRVGELGNIANLAGTLAPPESFSIIPSGPNKDVLYLVEVPVHALSQIRINRVALSVGSDFHNRQPKKNAPTGKCVQADVVPFVPVVEAHEGLGLQPASHAGVFRTQLNRRVPQSVEAVVAQDLSELITRGESASQGPIATAQDLAGDAGNGNGTVPAPVYCPFKYF